MQKQNISLLKKIVFPGILGNVLEWYDFLLYGFFAPLLAQHFFPLNNKTISLLATFGVFAVGFLMRPLGSLIFGYFGDRLGRKATLVTTVSLMAFATASIGLLPTYAEIGATATVLLTYCFIDVLPFTARFSLGRRIRLCYLSHRTCARNTARILWRVFHV